MPTKVKLADGIGRQRHYIKQWREWRKLSQDALLNRLTNRLSGFSKASLSRLENGKQSYTQDWVESIAWALDCTPAQMLMLPPTDPRAELIEIIPRLSGWRLERATAYIHSLLDDPRPETPLIPVSPRVISGSRKGPLPEGSHPQRSRSAVRRRIPDDEAE